VTRIDLIIQLEIQLNVARKLMLPDFFTILTWYI